MNDFPARERSYKDLLLSDKWDIGDAPEPRLRYAVFSLPRTGSELLCARLRLAGLGVPLEYFNTDVIAGRLGCLDANGQVEVMKYVTRLEQIRTTRNGVFGTKLQPRHLLTLSGGDAEWGLSFLRRFGKLIILRRRDVLLQAISMARSQLTGQWHVLPGDGVREVDVPDARLFTAITRCLGWLETGERLMRRAELAFEKAGIRSVFYEDLVAGDTLDRLIDWIGDGFGVDRLALAPTADYELPLQGNQDEALEIKARYLGSRGATSGPLVG